MRNNSKTISAIKDKRGNLLLEQLDIENTFQNHFTTIFNGEHVMKGIDHIYPKRILKSLADWLERPFEEEEIFESLNLCGRDKAPGPDGLTVEFFLNNWACVKLDVIRVTKNFFNNRRVFREVNLAHIWLIPKDPSADKVEDFGPIALCNTIYKIIAKCLAEMLKNYLPNLISKNQTFILDRKISDNILLDQELLQGFNRKHNAP